MTIIRVLGSLAFLFMFSGLGLVCPSVVSAELKHGASQTKAKVKKKTLQIPDSSWEIYEAALQPNLTILEKHTGGYSNMQKKSIQEQILDKHSFLEQRQAYEDMNRNYELRHRYGLTSQLEEQNHVRNNSNFTKGVVRSVFNYQLDQNLKKAEKNSSEGAAVKQLHDNVQNVVNGSSDVAVTESFKMGAHTNLRDQQGAVFVESSVINLTVGANMSDKINTGGFLNSGGRPEDHYTLLAGRTLPLLDLNTGVSYGVETTKMRTSFSRQITQNISAEFAQYRGLNRAKSQNQQREEILLINYGITF